MHALEDLDRHARGRPQHRRLLGRRGGRWAGARGLRRSHHDGGSERGGTCRHRHGGPRRGGLELGFGEFAITLEAGEIRPGPVTFVIRNGGQLVHGFEMEIEERGDSSGHGSGHDGLKIEGPAFGPGETIRIATELAPGVYEIECFVAEHDEMGMRATLVVRPRAPLLRVDPGPAEGEIEIADFAFAPTPLEVPVGTPVTWTNLDPTAHTVSASDGSFDSGTPPVGRAIRDHVRASRDVRVLLPDPSDDARHRPRRGTRVSRVRGAPIRPGGWPQGRENSMKTMKPFTSIASAGLILLAACRGGGEGSPDGGQASSTVTLRDNAFAPADPVIGAGDVELVNEGESPTFTIEGEDVDVEVDAGQTTTVTVDLPAGAYTLFCSFHRGQGMEGTLTVEA